MRLGVRYHSLKHSLRILTMNIMKLVKPTSWVFLGLLATTGASYAQEAVQKTRQGTAPVSGNPADSYEMHLHKAEALMENGKADEAYRLLEPLEFEHASKVDFDYLLGIAALDSGRADMATFALERVLSINPGHASARLDIARAYYQLGDLPRARTEFEAVMRQDISPAARANAQKYLDVIAMQNRHTRLSGYVEVSAGRDSNVNSSTSESMVFVDSFATMASLDTSNVKVSDNYYTAVAGGEISHDLNPQWSLYAGANLRKLTNRSQAQFDSVTTDIRGGIAYEKQANRIRISAISGKYDLGGTHNNDTSGIKGEWRHAFSPGNQLNAFAQSVQYRYDDPLMKPNDIDQQAVGLGWLHVASNGKTTLSGSVHYGSEKDVSPTITVPSIGNINPSGGRNDGAKNFSGFRIGGQTASGESTSLFASAGMQSGEYDKVNHLFLRKRKDRLYDIKLGANWHWDKLWTLRPQISYLRNDSNIAIYGYDRMDVSLTVRRDFR